MNELLEIKERLETERPIGWDGLPDIDLYMDQVVSYLPRQYIGSSEGNITSAMINNYVKDGLLPRASGKRYHRDHLAYLTVIRTLKSVLPVKDMKLLLDHEVGDGAVRGFYADFGTELDRALRRMAEIIPENTDKEDLADIAVKLALMSSAAKTACEQVIDLIRELEPAEDPKLAKEREKEASKRAKAEKKSKA